MFKKKESVGGPDFWIFKGSECNWVKTDERSVKTAVVAFKYIFCYLQVVLSRCIENY